MKKSDVTFIGFLIRSKKWIKLSLTESKSRQKTYLSQRRRGNREHKEIGHRFSQTNTERAISHRVAETAKDKCMLKIHKGA